MSTLKWIRQTDYRLPLTRINELAGSLPLEVAVVKIVVSVKKLEVFGQLSWRTELINVNVGVERRTGFVILRPSSHLKENL